MPEVGEDQPYPWKQAPPMAFWVAAVGALLVIVSVLGSGIALTAAAIGDSYGIILLPEGRPPQPWAYGIIAGSVGTWMVLSAGIWFAFRWWIAHRTVWAKVEVDDGA